METARSHNTGQRAASEDALYNWSSLRSQYLGEANVQLASAYEGLQVFAPGWSGMPGSMATRGCRATAPFSIRLAMASTLPITCLTVGLCTAMAAASAGVVIAADTETDGLASMDRPASTVSALTYPMAAAPASREVAAASMVVVLVVASMAVVLVVASTVEVVAAAIVKKQAEAW